MKLSKIFTIIALSATVTSSLPIPMVNADSTTVNETKTESQLLTTDLKETKADEVTKTPKEKTTDNNLKNQLVQAGTKTYNDYFPDDNLAEAVAEKMNSEVNATVTVEELAKITKLDARSQDIEDSTGIEFLTGLEVLNLEDNQLKSIDVSKNLNLKELTCSNNPLANLDVSKNLALEELTCENNELTQLDVSQNTALEYLYCPRNQLTKLDVSKNSALRYLACDVNQLTNLDVSKNPALTNLGCTKNQLTDLDVSQNPNLSTLVCSDNQLTNLDVSQNQSLAYLACDNNKLKNIDIDQNLALIELSCENNQLTNLDTTQNLALEILYCDDNQLTDLDVSKNVNLLRLFCNNNQLTSLAVGDTILNVRCNNNQLKDISFLPDYFTDDNDDYQAMDQTLVSPTQTTQNNTLVYAVPTDLLDKDGNIVSIIKPESGGIYDAATRTITWENLPDNGEVSYTFENEDYGRFSGRVTVPYTGKETISISSDDEISYKEGTTKTEAAFLADIHASVTPATETITSNFADVVDFQTPGKYVVTLSVAGSDVTKDIIVYVTAEPSEDNPVAPTPPKDKDDTDVNNEQSPGNDKDGTDVNSGKSTDKQPVKVVEKQLPKTGDITSLSLSLAGIVCLSFGILFFIKRKKKTV
ncbi:LapB repeat-containing protein [Listeria monocytogenes]|uniref:LapB repeat-containing protein n=1 Tax=Listeria monocytogenes TaxID=1639 RepID=UPI000775844F|nr:LapB repeat-containing protein [Listeria monocytogenes]EHC6019520.1 LapB repeat-containing protein [Listeria monocytogenes serotype 1/2a]EAC2298468.1 LPXTG cell wall anchor domain-containing protein [Listeria monocytogenes]EAC3667414.1 LPXTG cell wall anchor domain-containing protein [Listeria monocytogenes]EAD3610896.1 LPXTG cell wall anchor domain-containing protein [Listeria monocytogenes]EAD7569912.1 LPXTG cell wall anchor domain-containing protein [Listeria monocytogenes]